MRGSSTKGAGGWGMLLLLLLLLLLYKGSAESPESPSMLGARALYC